MKFGKKKKKRGPGQRARVVKATDGMPVVIAKKEWTPKRWGPAPKKFTADVRQRFLAGLASGLSINGAAALCHMNRRSILAIKQREQKEWEEAGNEGPCEFSLNWNAAIEAGTDALEDSAMRRAKDGVLEPIFQGGMKVGYVRRYSDGLVKTLLVARRPDKYKDRHDVTGVTQPPISGVTVNQLFLQGIDQTEASKIYLRLMRGEEVPSLPTPPDEED